MSGTDYKQIEQQAQTQAQAQRLTAQQMLVVSMLSLSTQEMEERIRDEVLDNPALEEGTEPDAPNPDEASDTSDDADGDTMEELDGSSMGSANDYDYDDDNDDSSDYRSGSDTTREEIPIDAGTSFFDILSEQLREQPLDEHQQAIGLYLIGSLDDDGLLRKPIDELVEVLAFRADIFTDAAEVEEILHYIQQFDPAGVGARDLKECLLLQLERKDDTPLVALQRRILTECFDDFTGKRWDRLAAILQADEADVEKALTELTRLNPHPGSSLSEAVGRGMQQLIPDFIMEGDGDDCIPVLNNFNIPTLRVSNEFRALLDNQSRSQNKAQKEAAQFMQQKIDSAQNFIQAVRQRERTLNAIMRAIVTLQKEFFQTGDESLLQPMILEDVEKLSGYDISTVSRVTSSKYVQTRFGTFPLKHFFSNRRVRIGGNDSDTYINSIDVTKELSAIVADEDKASPLSDEQLAALLAEKGFNVARRTVAKYRDQLGIPTARMRKK